MILDPNPFLKNIMELYNTNQIARAAKSAKKAVKKFPKDPRFATLAGTALAQSGETNEAVIFFQKAWKIAPNDPDSQENLARSLVMSNQHSKALGLIDKILTKRPNAPALLYLKSLSLLQIGNLTAALKAAKRSAEFAPDMALSHNICGVIHMALDQENKAIGNYQASITIDPKNPDTLANLSTALARADRIQDAFQTLNRALSIDPTHIKSLQSRAIIMAQVGDFDSAIKAYEALLVLTPTHAQSLNDLALLQTAQENEPLINQIKNALDQAPKQGIDRPLLNFSLATIEWQKQDFKKASRSLATANAGLARQRLYNAKAAELEFKNLTALDTHPCTLCADPRPIFVIGLPRSGTTLVEQILSANPKIAGLGELAVAQHLADEAFAHTPTNNAQTAADFHESYLKRLPEVPKESIAFIDKMPANYRFIGLLADAFPNATFINVQRDPRDIAVSLWRGYFPKNGLNFSYDFKSMAHVVNLYQTYMANWSARYPSQIHTVKYEDIVANIETQSRQIAEVCGVSWNQDMTRPEKNTRALRTASIKQARAPIHTKSIGNWKHLESDLAPFIDALDQNLWPEIF